MKADRHALLVATLWLFAGELGAQPAGQASVAVVINEVLVANRDSLRDADGDTPAWIELANRGEQPTRLLEWSLTDDRDRPDKWLLPDVVLAPGEFVVVFASGKNRRAPGAELHSNFSLDPRGEYLGLFDAGSPRRVVSEIAPELPEQRPDVSFGLSDSAQLRYLEPPSPGASNDAAESFEGLLSAPQSDAARGFYDEAFAVRLSTPAREAAIRYTVDGSEPTAVTGELYAGPISIAGTTVLRAAAFQSGFLPSRVVTRTYLFVDDVVRQPGMLSRIVEDPAYSDSILDGLRLIPTLSITMEDGDFADLQRQASLEGTKKELPASVELLYAPHLEEDARSAGRLLEGGFQVDAAVEGHSHSAPKRSFRVKFKRGYGPTRLRYPFFEAAPLNAESATDSFDRLILRAGIGMSWSSPFAGSPAEVTLARDQWQRDTQIAMSGIGSHGMFVHLYVNGRYWGIYNPSERADASFGAAYRGGDKEDYFATNHGIERGDGHLSGDSSRFDRLLAMAGEQGLENPARYEEFAKLLDVEKFADYVILFWYSGFGDGMDNNWYAGMPADPPGGLQFYMWDCEYIFINADPGPPANVGAWVPGYFFTGSYARTRIARLFGALLTSPEFRLLFADRIYHHLARGVLTDARSRERFRVLTEAIADAMIGESARWGGGRTRDGDWRRAVGRVDQRIDGNAERFLVALRRSQRGVYPAVDPPFFGHPGGLIPTGFPLSLSSYGEIYLTTDGTDPRLPGGAISPAASAVGLDWQVVVPEGAEARYLVPEDDSLRLEWTQVGFDDSLWSSGPTGLGFAGETSAFRDAIATDIEAAMRRRNSSLYVRIPFQIEGDVPSHAVLRVKYDDGFTAYLNGARAAARGAPQGLDWDSRAASVHADSAAASFESILLPDGLLRAGRNVLAIQGLNVSVSGRDFLILPRLEVAAAGQPVRLNRTTRVRARVLVDGEWSPLDEAVFVDERLPDLRVTEVMYHPPEPGDDSEFSDDDFEYLELRNVGVAPLLLDGMSVSGSVRFRFPFGVPSRELAPGAFTLLVRDREAFATRYGSDRDDVAGEFRGALGNGGGDVVLTDSLERKVLEFSYSDEWFPATDGRGASLEILDAQGAIESWGDPSAWRANPRLGTPGAGPPLRTGLQRPGDFDRNGRLDLADVLGLLEQLFSASGRRSPCQTAAGTSLDDSSGDGRVNLVDAIYLLEHLFRRGPPPAAGSECVETADCPDACP